MIAPNTNAPVVAEMSDETITENTIAVNSQHKNMRLFFVLNTLVQHLHDFAREVRLTTEEWEEGIKFLTECGHITTDIRQEFVLLSDVLGFSVLVDSISHPKPDNATLGTLLGPFHTHDAEVKENGETIVSEGKGEPLLIEGKLTDTKGNSISDATIDLWHCDKDGFYDTQYEDREKADLRGIIKTGKDGSFVIKASKPVPYPIPSDGPVGKLLKRINRHPYRPAHIHFIIEKPGYDKLITALYEKGDPYETSDAVFGVKSKLLYTLGKVGMEKSKQYNMSPDDWYLNWDFKIITDKESRELVYEKNKKAIGLNSNLVLNENGLPEMAPLD